MANKGPLDVVTDGPAINEIIVFANQYRQDILENCQIIQDECKKCTEDDSLNGGDGEEIKANFMVIASGCRKLEESVKSIVDNLNKNLEVIIKMSKGTTLGSSTESAKKAAAGMNVMKKE